MLKTIALAIPSAALLGYLANRLYFSGGRCTSTKRLNEKVVIVTGANTGIGYYTALDMAKRGATVILACRDEQRGKDACKKIVLDSRNTHVEYMNLDLSSFASIREFVNKFNQKYQRLDILINNAGLSGVPFSKTVDGFETHFGVMHLGHFLLTNLLLDKLKASAPSRIVNVSSLVHKRIPDIQWDNLQMEKNYKPLAAYAQAKLANILFTVELARRFASDNITSVSLHPGVVRTEIIRNLKKGFSFIRVMFFLLKPLLYMLTKSSLEGAQTTIYCAVDDSIPDFNGRYFADCQVAKCTPQASNVESAKKLWEISEKLVKLN